MRTTEEFGQTLLDRRHALGLSQQELALSAGVNRRVVGELERGKPGVRLDIALRVAAALGMELEFSRRGGR